MPLDGVGHFPAVEIVRHLKEGAESPCLREEEVRVPGRGRERGSLSPSHGPREGERGSLFRSSLGVAAYLNGLSINIGRRPALLR